MRELRFERTADTAVCKRNDAARIGDLRAVGDEFRVDVYFSDIVYDDGDFIAFLICQNVI